MASSFSSTPVQVLDYSFIQPSDGMQIKGALNQSPVGVSVAANCNDFMYYSGGVFDGANCPNDVSDLDHAVQLIGYATQSSDGTEYFYLKNSWGETWGINGYMHIEYSATGNGVIGVNLEPIIPKTTNYNTEDHTKGGAFTAALSGMTTLAVASLALAFSF